MKRLSFLFLMAGIVLLTSCDTTREITLNKDGSGTLITTSDMSSLIGVAKMSGKDMDKLDEKSIDTTMALDQLVDSLPGLSPEDKTLVKTGTLGFIMNLADDKFVTKLEFPFKSADQLGQLDKLSSKVVQQTIKKQISPAGMDEGITESSIDDYFTTTYSKSGIEKKLIKEKYADVANDKDMQSLKELSGEGLPFNNTLVINLPSPVKKVEGKNVTLSEDKKKVTISNSMEDFFDDATKLEFKITY